MQFTHVRCKEKDYDMSLMSENCFTAVRNKKKSFPSIWKWKNLFPSYFDPEKHCRSYLKREKSGSMILGLKKIQFTTVRKKEKDYDIYLKSEKLVHSNQDHEKLFSIYL